MAKLLWYMYFIIYLVIESINLIKIRIMSKKSPKEAEIYAFSRAQKIARHVLKKTKTNMEVSGIENIPEGNCVFIANHQAIFDGFALLAYIDKPFGFIAKKEIEKLPLVRGWLKSVGSIFINRESPRESIKTIQAGVEKLNEGHSMMIFPEGTRSLGSKMNPFKKGSMRLAIKSKVPIVPITIDGTYNVVEVGKKVTGNKIKMVIHKPIYVNLLTKEEELNLAENIHDIIEDELNNICKSKQLS